jgi:hypothetical protein
MILTTKNKVGLVIAFILGVIDIPGPLLFAPPEGEVGPPMGVLILASICGIVTVVAVVMAWRSASAGAIRAAAGSRIVSMLTSLPAFFVDVDAVIKVVAAVFVLVTIASVVLMLSSARRAVTATD